jgi:hypothetical protein
MQVDLVAVERALHRVDVPLGQQDDALAPGLCKGACVCEREEREEERGESEGGGEGKCERGCPERGRWTMM